MNEFIDEEVAYYKNFYNRKMRESKKLFFDYLNEGKTENEFNQELRRIWNIDHSYMDKKIQELEEMVKNKDIADYLRYTGESMRKDIELLFAGRVNQKLMSGDFYKLNPESEFRKIEEKYLIDHVKSYRARLKVVSKDYVNKEAYLGKWVEKYDNYEATIPYFNQDGTVRAWNTIATYNSMLYNVNLTRSAWNRSLYDSVLLNNEYYFIPPHMYSCPVCAEHQGKVYDKREMEEAIGDGVGHPNCKCTWVLYWDKSQLNLDTYNTPEWHEWYHTRQKLQSLNLERYRLRNDRQIQLSLGNQAEADKLLQKIRKLNSSINELRQDLPTDVMPGLSTRQ